MFDFVLIKFLKGIIGRINIYWRRSGSNTLFWTLSLVLTLLLDEINVCLTTLCWFHFQSVGPTLILPNKRVSVRENAQKRASLAFLILKILIVEVKVVDLFLIQLFIGSVCFGFFEEKKIYFFNWKINYYFMFIVFDLDF